MAKKKAAVKTKTCNCVADTNKQLAPKGFELDDRMVMSFGEGTADMQTQAPVIQLRRLGGKRGKASVMFCLYCPFCGKKK